MCGLVALQASFAVWADSGLFLWIAGGGTIDQSTMGSESLPPFPEAGGFMLHGMNGMMVIPVVALVLLVVTNSTSEVHLMHLHGHSVLVTAREGVTATGSPWWTDSFDVQPGERFDIVFRADNPGIWMDHCHNLDHARDGMVAHLAYTGVTTPFVLGGPARNEPE